MVLTWQAPSRREWLSWPCSSLYLVGIQCSWACKEDLSRPLLYTALPMALCTVLWCLLYINTSVEENIKQILGTFQGPQVDTHTMKVQSFRSLTWLCIHQKTASMVCGELLRAADS